jgi:hypothetical protein
LAICLIVTLALPPMSAQAQQIWFSPGDDLEVKGVVAHPDFMRLFDSQSPWPTGLGRVNGIEGLGSARQHNVYPGEMKKRGIPLDYAVMDEPLYYGHDCGGKNACQFPVSQVAASDDQPKTR